MSARSISTLSITVTANTNGASTALVTLQNQVSNTAASINKKAAIIGGALGSLFGGRTGGAGGFFGGLVGGPIGALVGGTIGAGLGKGMDVISGGISLGVSSIKEAVSSMLEVGGEFEMALAIFSEAAGSKEGGKSILSGMQQLATGTIFSSDQLNRQSILLKGYGVSASELVPTMTKLALIAQKTGRGEEGLGRIALAFGQAKQAGRLFGTELRQFTEAGVGIGEFAQTMGVSAAQFRDLVEQGQVGFDVVARTLNRLGSQSESAAEAMNNTFVGRLNSVKDLALQSFGAIGMGIIDAFQLGPVLGNVATMLQSLPEKVKDFYPYLERARMLVEPIAEALITGFEVAFTAGKNFIGGFLPSMSEAADNAKGLAHHLVVGIGRAIDATLQLGKHMLKIFRPIFAGFDWIMSKVTDVKIPTLTGLVDRGIAGIEAAQNAAGGIHGHYEMAKRFEKENKGMLQGGNDFKPNFDQGGITVGPPGLPGAVNDLAKKINQDFAEGKHGSVKINDFLTNMANLKMAEGAGLITNKAAADSFIANQFKDMAASMGKLEATLPRAIEQNTVEGQQQIEKVLSNMRNSNQDLPALMKEFIALGKMQVKKQEEQVSAIRGLQLPRVLGL